ncbi:hypothetical protein PAXRUDRAFT_823232 [Paxillus rubicundulus Ve08.2h10]|uniref:Uncharacterized protein n=1 Tax=Paxillus rubicundulus Ve08.2h10 TaxID=930991 RepID=A0A0D0E913_9AGAM|nr:hypothetical protein PAXRUDRAFT_823232 [Paxillus rubicundulus Ve08.2h10]
MSMITCDSQTLDIVYILIAIPRLSRPGACQSAHTPRALHHAPFPNAFIEPWDCTTKGVWYFFMEECPGVPLDTIIGGMTPTRLDHIADQLLAVLNEMRSHTVPTTTSSCPTLGTLRTHFRVSKSTSHTTTACPYWNL